MTDIVETLVTYLKADAAVLALVGARVYGIEIPPAQAPNMPIKTVTVRPEGGELQRGTVPTSHARFEFWCTAETFHEAVEIDGAVYDALLSIKREQIDGVGLIAALPAMGYRTSREATTGWRATVRGARITAEE